MLLEYVKKYIVEKNLILQGDKVIVGFSGGADSTALVHILYCLHDELGFTLEAAHLHHGIRGAEADRDLEFVKSFCENLNIEFKYKKCDIPTIAKENKVSEETAGREERYRFFDELAENGAKIATAHNKNDNAETVIHHIIRGSGTQGLCGIAAERGNIIRPLINVERREIERYCKDNGLEYVTDSTNAQTEYTRNKIRHCIMPEMEKINPRITASICKMAVLASEDNDYLDIEAKKAYEKYVTEKDGQAVFLLDSDLYPSIRKRVFMKMAQKVGAQLDFEKITAIEELAEKGISGKSIDITGGRAEISYNTLIIGKEQEKREFDVLFENKNVYIPECGYSAVLAETGVVLPKNAEIRIRSRKDGDRIRINGMTKKVKNILISKKIPKSERGRIPIVTVNGEIAYIHGVANADILKKYNKNDETFVLKFQQGEYNNE